MGGVAANDELQNRGSRLKVYNKIFNNFRMASGLLLVLFIAAYWVPIKSIVHTWITNDDYSYGFLIPAVSAYLFWDMRDRMNGLRLKNYWPSLPFLVLMILVSIYGILGSSGNISRPAVPILFILFFIFCYGLDAFKQFYLPLCFLVFIVPLPAVLDRTIGLRLKAVSSQLGGLILRAFGQSVHVAGNVIDLGVAKLQIVDACSGLRFLFPLFALGIIYAYFFEKISWKRFVCVAASAPIAIFSNGLRIGITGILTKYFGPAMAEGFFHEFSGWMIFIVAFGFFFVLSRILRFFPPRINKNTKNTNIGKKIKAALPEWEDHNKGLMVSILLMITVGILSTTTNAMPPIKLKSGIDCFPLTINSWTGKQEYIDPKIKKRSGAEESFAAIYQNAAGESVSLYIGYRESAFLENENFFHSPTVCLPAAGWKNKHQIKHQIKNMPFGQNFNVTQMIIEQMENRRLVYFWFQTKNQESYSKDINRFHLALHALKNDNTHDLFIRLMVPIGEDEELEDIQRTMDQFAREMMNALLSFLKQNQYSDHEVEVFIK